MFVRPKKTQNAETQAEKSRHQRPGCVSCAFFAPHLPELARPNIPVVHKQAAFAVHGAVEELSLIDYLAMSAIFS